MRIRAKVCLWWGLAAHNFAKCMGTLTKQPIRPAVQEMRLQQPVRKTRFRAKREQEPQVVLEKPLHPNRVFVKVNGHPAIALIDLQTIGGELINAQFMYLYKLSRVKIETKTLAMAI